MPLLVYLLGGSNADRASICSIAAGGPLRVEPVASIARLTPESVATVDAFLVWDDGKVIPQLRNQLSILRHRAPIVALAQDPPVRQVVQALASGAVDYLAWPCGPAELADAVSSAVCTSTRMLPLQHRAVAARHRLERLTPGERQVLTAMAQGLSNKAIADLLGTDARSVETRRRALLGKLEVEHSAEAIRLEIEASFGDDRDRQPSWLAPWLSDASRPGSP